MKSHSIKRWICLVVAVLVVAGCDIDNPFNIDAAQACGEARSNVNGAWQMADVASCPPPTWSGAMAPMTIDGRPTLILFGGVRYTGPDKDEKGVSDTWMWDGSSWTQLHPTVSPPALYDESMVYDPVHGQIVLFGGTNTSGQGVDLTYTFDGHNWTDRTDYGDVHTNAHTPPARRNTMMAFDASDGGVVVFGGKLDDGALTNSVWLWNGATWSILMPASACDANAVPCSRDYGGLAPDPATHGVVLFGGSDVTGTALANETWVFHAGGWTKKVPAHSPGARSLAAFAPLDDNTDLLFGGDADNAGQTWSWDGTDWTSVPLCTSGSSCAAPGGVIRAQMGVLGATSGRPARMVIFGGTGIEKNSRDSERHIFDVNDETWSYEPAIASGGSADWLKLQSQGPAGTARPSGRSEASLATFVNESTGAFEAVLFGGTPSAGGGPLGDTWLWNGTSWSLIGADGTGPPARSSAAVAWDNISNNVVLFGGKDGSNNTLSDTWIFNPSTLAWSQVTGLTTSPPARRQAAMATDVPDLGVLLFGGGNSSGTLSDTWVWSGLDRTWTQRSVSGPSNRSEAVMGLAPDGSGGYGVVLFGGINLSGTLDDTWTWDGSAWTARSPSTHPSARDESAMASLDDEAVLFGGISSGGSDLADTWEWNGTGWREVTPAVSPPARSRSVATGAQTSASDTSVNVLLFGGSPSSVDNDTWRFEP